MPPQETVVVRIQVGKPHQEWCDRCLTSAAIRVGLLVLLPTGVRQIGELHGCMTCDPGLRSSTGRLVNTWTGGVQSDGVADTVRDLDSPQEG